jgi:hypothetical protein
VSLLPLHLRPKKINNNFVKLIITINKNKREKDKLRENFEVDGSFWT